MESILAISIIIISITLAVSIKYIDLIYMNLDTRFPELKSSIKKDLDKSLRFIIFAGFLGIIINIFGLAVFYRM